MPTHSASPLPNRGVVLIAGLALAGGAASLSQAQSAELAVLFLLGAALGIALYHAAFGFTGGWRAVIAERRSAGLRAQFLLLALATLLLFPTIIAGEALFGVRVGGAMAPLTPSLLLGAALFGFGMQLGGGCGSGTLFTVGGGHARMLVTLAFFIVGAVLGSLHLPWWLARGFRIEFALGAELGVLGGMAAQLVFLAALWMAAARWEWARHGAVERITARRSAELSFWTRLIHGPWPLHWGAIALAILALGVLLVSGSPWSVTFAFGLWGAKALAALGVDVAAWEFWTWPYPAEALTGSIFAETTSVMDFGIILGAALSAGLAGRFAPDFRIPLRALLAAMLGGLLMGYGARLAFGCNIGALFSGIASGSLHGWVWFACAFLGSWAGVKARPWFRL